MKKNISIFFPLFLVIILSSCTSIDEKRYSGQRYTPTNPAQVEILTEFPTRPHIEIGEIKGTGSVAYHSASGVNEDIREAAANMGADAIVLRGRSKVDYDFWQGVSHQKKAIAIKWTGAANATKPAPSETPASSPSNNNSLPLPQPQ